MRSSLIAAALASLVVASAEAAQTAPPPPGWTMSADEPQREYERPRGTPAGTLRGIYGHGVANPIDMQASDPDSEGASPICRESPAA